MCGGGGWWFREGGWGGGESLTARNQNVEPKEVRDFCDSVPCTLEELKNSQRVSEQLYAEAKLLRTCKAAYIVRCNLVQDLVEAENSCGFVQSHPLHPLS